MKKQVFYLKDEGEFLEDFTSELESLEWVYRWTEWNLFKVIKRHIYSVALRELIENNFNEN